MHGNRESLVEAFDTDASTLSAELLSHRAISFAASGGVDESSGIRVAYQGSSIGSERVVVHHSLPQGSIEATLAYDVRFCDGFQFVKGGKLHGLGPAEPVAGGLPVGPAQWSARVIFQRNGRIATYLYHQELQGRYGEAVAAADFNFEPGRFYNVALYVRLNDPPEDSNGRAEIYVNGTKIISHENVRFRALGGDETLINKLLFTTFHGGHTRGFAPRNNDGKFSRECAYFDNFTVYPHYEFRKNTGP